MRVNVLNMSSGDARPRIPDFAALAAKGILGVVHRAGEGTEFSDPLYKDRRTAALGAGLLWGGMHTINAGDALSQAEIFLENVGIHDENVDMTQTLLAVEYSAITDPAALHQLYQFCGAVDRLSPYGVSIVVRGGAYLRETLREHDAIPQTMAGVVSYMRQHRLWCDESVYVNQPAAPAPFPWEKYFLRVVQPIPVDPIIGKSGTNTFDGDADTLKNSWAA